MKVYSQSRLAKRLLSTILLALLFLGACIPVHIQEPPTPTSTPTVVPPTATATPTSAPTHTCTPPTLTATPTMIPEQPALGLTAQSAVLIDAQTGDILYEKKAQQRMFPASTTKILTALLALEYFQPDETIWVGEEVNLAWAPLRLDAQKAGLHYAQELSMKELLYGLLLASGSDAAFVIAVNVARRESGDDIMPVDQAVAHFSALMNERSRALGALETNFVNPDGYQDPQHYSTAYDLARIAQGAMRVPLFRDIVSTAHYTRPIEVAAKAGSFRTSWTNTNRLVDRQDSQYYASASGIKTGTTLDAGYCLVSSANFKAQEVIAVVLDSTQDGVWSDSVRLLDYAKDHLP